QVLREPPRRVRHSLESRNAAHIHDVRLPAAFDHVDAIEVDAKCAAAPQDDLAEIGGRREQLSQLFFFGPARKGLLDREDSTTDDVDLAIAAIGWMIALGEHRLAAL